MSGRRYRAGSAAGRGKPQGRARERIERGGRALRAMLVAWRGRRMGRSVRRMGGLGVGFGFGCVGVEGWERARARASLRGSYQRLRESVMGLANGPDQPASGT